VHEPRVVRAPGGHDHQHQQSAALAPADSAGPGDYTDDGAQIGRRTIDDSRRDDDNASDASPVPGSDRVAGSDNLRRRRCRRVVASGVARPV
jgi:hypothetical protein